MTVIRFVYHNYWLTIYEKIGSVGVFAVIAMCVMVTLDISRNSHRNELLPHPQNLSQRPQDILHSR